MSAASALALHPDRLLPADPGTRAVERRLYQAVRDLPILPPHGHIDAATLLDDEPLPDPTALFITPDHYVTRLLHASGVALDELGVGQGRLDEPAARRAWQSLRELARLPRHAGALLARVRTRRNLRCHRAPVRADCRQHLRPGRRAADDGHIPAARPAGPLSRRGTCYYRRPGRRPRRPRRTGVRRHVHGTRDPEFPSGPVSRTGSSPMDRARGSTRCCRQHRHRRLRQIPPRAREQAAPLHRAWRDLDRSQPLRRAHRPAVVATSHAYLPITSGFIDDTRALCSIPARHDMSHRLDSGYLARLVAEHRLDEDEALETVVELVTGNPRRVFKL
jgi:hypothetical protein